MYRESNGFPSQTVMKWSLGTDALQATVNGIIQIYSLSTRVSSNAQEKALSGLNLAFSLIGVISALITLCLKYALLEGVADTEDDSMPRPNNEEGSGLASFAKYHLYPVSIPSNQWLDETAVETTAYSICLTGAQ